MRVSMRYRKADLGRGIGLGSASFRSYMLKALEQANIVYSHISLTSPLRAKR